MERLGPDGLLSGLVAQLLETALGVELADHLGYEPHERRPAGSTNARNGTTRKRVQTDVGPVDLEVPRDREGSFDPVVVPKHASLRNPPRSATGIPLYRC